MIHLTDKHDCCGCSACAQRCPKRCITMRVDGEGFAYPDVDASRCVDCGLCEQACPLLHTVSGKRPLACLAVKNNVEADRLASSSGGMFIALARKVLSAGGVVAGAVFDGSWNVVHTCAETTGGVEAMMGSKYVQSSIGDTYLSVERCLKDGRSVLFAGTPCQVSGLHCFLRKDYPNLLSVDIMCHGVPSPAVWQEYLSEAFLAPPSGKGGAAITNIDFRSKAREGWKRYNIVVEGVYNASGGGVAELASSVYVDNPFFAGLLADAYLRPSCYRCKCKNGASRSDITIGDYWGVDFIIPEFDDDKGVSIVTVNTRKGLAALEGLDIDVRTADMEKAKLYNGGFNQRLRETRVRTKFFKCRAQGKGFHRSLTEATKLPTGKKAVGAIRKLVRKIISR